MMPRFTGLVAMGMVATIMSPSSALGVDDPYIAPDLKRLETILLEGETILKESRHVGVAVARAQNHWTERLTGKPWLNCNDREANRAVSLAKVFGERHRDLVQSLRVQARRVRAVIDSPTVEPIASESITDRVVSFEKSVESQAQAWLVSAAWQARLTVRWSKWCEPGLRVGDGLKPHHIESIDEQIGAVAIFVRDGVLCPEGIQGDNRVHVVADGKACWAKSTCGCKPERVHPGAILGPEDAR